MALLKGGSNTKSCPGLGDVSVMATWVAPFFSPFWFKTNQTSITQKKQLCIGHPTDPSIWIWVAWTSEEAMEPGKCQQAQQWTNTIFLAEEVEGEGGELGVYPTTRASDLSEQRLQWLRGGKGKGGRHRECVSRCLPHDSGKRITHGPLRSPPPLADPLPGYGHI